MFYIQTTIGIDEEVMEIMTESVLNDLERTLAELNLPLAKEIGAAVLEQALKTLLEEKELDN